MPYDSPIGPELSETERRLLDAYQKDFPLDPRPFAAIGARLGLSEQEVISRLRGLAERGCVSRVGAVVAPHTVGYSTLAALAVPAHRLEAVAAIVSAYPGVNHNYERQHRFNLWFVVTGEDRRAVARVLHEIAAKTGLKPLDLPLLESFHIDLGFHLKWS